ncbi:PREDICTED: beta-hexosaminidase subunit beta-like [Papilio xuthus]|uniref:Beta-hexosaminidase n=1 Tax=Papilio xuthus TaxID=66420 RepID=A0AAJ7E514_PAPXU|nr:PREDICTED: beta-hexosaminidase subunit beta-like [Papilio xuthus]
MLRFLTIFLITSVNVNCIYIVNPGPKYPPTKGEVWPKPQNEITELTYYTFDPLNFKVKVTNNTCDILISAIERYSYIVKSRKPLQDQRPVSVTERRQHARQAQTLQLGVLQELQVQLTEPCEEYPYLEMDEKYRLNVLAVSVLTSASVWGILRGLETFAQKFYISHDMNELRINTSVVVDFPEYAHRGLLLDTGRHYISVPNILLTLDAMTINKMNVFHWHIVDDQSFPYQSEKFPDLSLYGAYHASMVYTKNDIARIVEYARLRGIRVLPEFDVPGHTRSWGNAYPNILTSCYHENEVVGLGPMNPIRNITYKMIRDLFHEVQAWFPDKHLHIGGDEVRKLCWRSNPEIREYMQENGLKVEELHALFMQNTIPLLADGSKIVVWQDVFDENVPLTSDTLIQVWKDEWIHEMVKVLKTGHRVLFSSSWYLNYLQDEWPMLYMADPRRMVRDETDNNTLPAGVIGGEACMWGEKVDDRNVISSVWPRASAVAERLWSAPTLGETSPRPEVYQRIEEHVCRMNRRGIAAQPASGPGFCLV